MNAETILKALRDNSEGCTLVDKDGTEWRDVYLDNARPTSISNHQFAGFLSALEKTGDYKPVDGYAWGSVRTKR
jgi:hypothetical protein